MMHKSSKHCEAFGTRIQADDWSITISCFHEGHCCLQKHRIKHKQHAFIFTQIMSNSRFIWPFSYDWKLMRLWY